MRPSDQRNIIYDPQGTSETVLFLGGLSLRRAGTSPVGLELDARGPWASMGIVATNDSVPGWRPNLWTHVSVTYEPGAGQAAEQGLVKFFVDGEHVFFNDVVNDPARDILVEFNNSVSISPQKLFLGLLSA